VFAKRPLPSQIKRHNAMVRLVTASLAGFRSVFPKSILIIQIALLRRAGRRDSKRVRTLLDVQN